MIKSITSANEYTLEKITNKSLITLYYTIQFYEMLIANVTCNLYVS